MNEGRLRVWLVLRKALEDDRVGAFAEHTNLAVRPTDDSAHALPGRVELANVQDLVLEPCALDVDEDGLGLARLRRRLAMGTD
jgi:hypothetical protein